MIYPTRWCQGRTLAWRKVKVKEYRVRERGFYLARWRAEVSFFYQARGEADPVVLHLLGGGCLRAADSSRQIT